VVPPHHRLQQAEQRPPRPDFHHVRHRHDHRHHHEGLLQQLEVRHRLPEAWPVGASRQRLQLRGLHLLVHRRRPLLLRPVRPVVRPAPQREELEDSGEATR
jgi:hypothetical protein